MFKSLSLLLLLFSVSFNCLGKNNILVTYANIAEEKYNDSLNLAQALLNEINVFLDNPTSTNL